MRTLSLLSALAVLAGISPASALTGQSPQYAPSLRQAAISSPELVA